MGGIFVFRGLSYSAAGRWVVKFLIQVGCFALQLWYLEVCEVNLLFCLGIARRKTTKGSKLGP